MPEIDKLVISVELNSSKFKQDLEQLKKSLESLPKNTSKINESIKNIFSEKTSTEFKKNFTKVTQSFKDTVSTVGSDGKKLSDTIQKTFQYKFFKDVDSNTKKSESIIGNSIKNISNILSGGLKGIGSYFGAQFATDFVRGVTSKNANTQFLSRAFNVSTSNLQTVQQLFKLIGGSAESASSSIAQLYNRLNSPFDVGLARGFKLLNLNPQDEKGNKKDPATLILEAIKKASTLPERQRNTALQFLGLPTEAQALANKPQLINTYLKSITANKGIVSNEEIAKDAEIEARFVMLGQRWDRIKSGILDTIIPALEALTGGVEKLLHINSTELAKKTTLHKSKEGIVKHFTNQFKELKNMQFGFGKNSETSLNKPQFMPVEKTKKAISSTMNLDPNGDEMVPPIMISPRNINQWQHNTTHKYVPSPAQLLPQNNTTNTTNQQQVSMNIGNISVPNITNANQFTKELHKMALTGYGFSGNLLA